MLLRLCIPRVYLLKPWQLTVNDIRITFGNFPAIAFSSYALNDFWFLHFILQKIMIPESDILIYYTITLIVNSLIIFKGLQTVVNHIKISTYLSESKTSILPYDFISWLKWQKVEIPEKFAICFEGLATIRY